MEVNEGTFASPEIGISAIFSGKKHEEPGLSHAARKQKFLQLLAMFSQDIQQVVVVLSQVSQVQLKSCCAKRLGSNHRTSKDEQGAYNHLQNTKYLGSIIPFSVSVIGCIPRAE